jgi:glycosyltransferase involved in cell wall biosynthesis
MTIGIILHPYDEKNPAGLGRSIFELTKTLIAHDKNNDYIIYVKSKPRISPMFPGNNWKIVVLGTRNLWLGRGFKRAPRSDVYLFNTPVLPLFYRPKRSIVIAHDFAYRYFPSSSLYGRWREIVLRWCHRYALTRADHIIAVSYATKDDVVNFYKINPEKISVIYWGFKNICGLKEKEISVPDNFFLSVGVLKERKNIFNTLKAFFEFAEKNHGYSLVIAGNTASDYGNLIRGYVEKKNGKNSVRFIGFVSDNELSFLYRRATALIFPSFIEGFGFPILEAMDCGLPVITSNSSSLAEIAGAAALLVNPYNVMEISGAMEDLITRTDLRRDLVRKGRARAKQFNWEKTAQAYLAVFTKVLSLHDY